MTRNFKIAALVFMGLLLSACASEPLVEELPGNSGSAGGATTSGYGAGGAGAVDQWGAGGAGAGSGTGSDSNYYNDTPAKAVVYFEYDSAAVSPQYMDVIRKQANILSRSTQTRVILEGNTDESGSPEYNIGLGQRRADSVKNLLIANGVPASQIDTVSYGEEKPAMPGSEEAAYRKNRRVEFHY